MTVISQSTSYCDPDGLGRDVTEAPPPRSSTFRISLSRMFSLIEEYDHLEGGGFQEHSKKRVIDVGLENSSGFLNCDQTKRPSVEVRLPSRGPCLLKDEDCLSQCEEYLHQNSEGDTRLHVAIVQQLPLLVRDLVGKVPHPKYLDIKNDDAQTALHVAVITRQADVITWLLEAGADRMLRDGLGNTALHLACQMGEMDCVKALTSSSQHKDVKTCVTKELKSPCRVLGLSSAKELINCMKVPIQNCQMVDLKLEKAFAKLSPGQTKTIVNPCQQKSTKAVDKLLETKVPTAFYQTFDVISDKTLANLCKKRDIRCNDEMKNQWFEINETDFFAGKVGGFHRDEKHYLVSQQSEDSVAVKEEILPHVEESRASFSPQELSVLNYEGESCAHVAVNHGHLDVLRRLVGCGVDLNAREAKSGNTVLHVAVERGIDCVSRYLLEDCVKEGGFKLETRNYAGRTVLDLALDVNPRLAEEIARLRGLNVGGVAKKRENKSFRHSMKNSTRKGKS